MTHYEGSVPETQRKTDWRDNAACVAPGVDPDIFHAGDRNTLATGQARTICDGCPSRVPCLTNAYNEGDEWGIYAGLTPRQRRAALRKAEGNVARAVADVLNDTTVLLHNIYFHHIRAIAGGHVLWTDTRQFINVRNKPYTVHQVAWIALHGTQPMGHVQRACDVEGCVAKACLTDRWMRNRAAAAKKVAA